MYHFDVKAAFLNKDIQEEVYVDQPKGYAVKGIEHKVYQLRKALYGLKEAHKAWYSKINHRFQCLGFVRS